MPTILAVCARPNATDGNNDFILRAGLASPFRQEAVAGHRRTATGWRQATETRRRAKGNGLSAPDFISDSTSSIIWRSSVSLISFFTP